MVKCEENRRPLIEIKQESSDHEESYDESHAKHRANSSKDKPSSSSLSAVDTENSYEFLGHMKYEQKPSKKPDIVCHLCQKVYCKKTHNENRKQYFIAHLVKAHDYRHLRGYTVPIHCRSCNTKKRRLSFVVGDGNNYNFSDVCSRCQRYRRQPMSDGSDGPPNQHRGSMRKNFTARPDLKAELQECQEATAEAPTAAGKPDVQADESANLTTAEPSSSKKRDGNVCHLCEQVYYKKTRYAYHRMPDFVAHLVKAHDYRHLRGHRVLTYCRHCNIGRERWSFVVRDGDNYKYSDECSTCRGCRGRASMASQRKNFMARQEPNTELREGPEAKAEIPSAFEEPAASEAHPLPQLYC